MGESWTCRGGGLGPPHNVTSFSSHKNPVEVGTMVMPSEETEAQRGKVIGSRPHSFQGAELRYAGRPQSLAPCLLCHAAPSPPPQLIKAPRAPPRGPYGKALCQWS